MKQDLPDRTELLQLMGHAIATTGQSNQFIWTQGTIFWAVNAVLVGALFQTGEFPKDPRVGVIISLFGLGIAIVWRLLQDRLLLLLLRDEQLVTRIQQELNVPDHLFVSRRPSPSERNELGIRTAPAKKVLRISNAFVILLWLLLLLGFSVSASVAKTPNPSLERTSTGLALGPRTGSGHHPLRGPNANPAGSAQLKR